jgi:hypothetical protein
MFDEKFENKIKKHAGEIFGHDDELPAGHRKRFEQRLKAQNVEQFNVVTVNKSLKKWLITVVAAAAVFAGLIFLSDVPAEEEQRPALADVRNFYSMQFEEAVDATKLLVQDVDEEYQRIDLLAGIEEIEKEPVPDVQITDDEYIEFLAIVYTNKIEILKNIQNIIKENI